MLSSNYNNQRLLKEKSYHVFLDKLQEVEHKNRARECSVEILGGKKLRESVKVIVKELKNINYR